MADTDKSTPGGKLPPLSPRPKNNDEEVAVKPVRKKKKKPPAAETEAEPEQKDAKPTPKRRRRTPSAGRDTDTEEKKEDETAETKPATKTKKKKSKPKQATDTGEQPVSDRSEPSPTGEDVTGSKASLITKGSKEGTPRKKGKKKKVAKKTKTEEDEYVDSGLAADLACLEDDIKKEEDQKEDIELPQTTNVRVLRSQPTEKIYVETIRGFKKENKAKLAKRIAAEEAERQIVPEERSKTTIELALQSYSILKTLSLFIHGITAGAAVWQIIIVYILSGFGNTDFLEHYQSLALPVQCTAYLLLAICLVSACDRFDIGSPTRRFVLQAFTLQNGAIAIIFYFISVVLSIVLVATDDKMHLYYQDSNLWANGTQIDEELTTWRSINSARGAFAVLGWVVLSITPNADRLSRNLKEGDDDDLLGNSEEITASPA